MVDAKPFLTKTGRNLQAGPSRDACGVMLACGPPGRSAPPRRQHLAECSGFLICKNRRRYGCICTGAQALQTYVSARATRVRSTAQEMPQASQGVLYIKNVVCSLKYKHNGLPGGCCPSRHGLAVRKGLEPKARAPDLVAAQIFENPEPLQGLKARITRPGESLCVNLLLLVLTFLKLL